ncbi:unnamed protein product [Hydatigera taeniaeformis]|uniref:Cystatin domain-containing protein n=1 Tax=Hydatigena taeniaeformis TaxID=6205 RepID=A0A0R3X495_HYDTA|nr:unnamed protein product [Hydatigera taeniaeformis]
MLWVVAALHLAALVVAGLDEIEPIVQRHEYPLGGVIPLTPKVLQSKEVEERVERALRQLSRRNGGLMTYRIIHIRSGTRQVVNGFKYVFVVEVESLPTEEGAGTESVSEVYRVRIYEPASRGAKRRYFFKKIPTNEK